MADEEVERFDDTLGELFAGVGSIMVSTVLILLVQDLRTSETESLPRRADYNMINIVG